MRSGRLVVAALVATFVMAAVADAGVRPKPFTGYTEGGGSTGSVIQPRKQPLDNKNRAKRVDMWISGAFACGLNGEIRLKKVFVSKTGWFKFKGLRHGTPKQGSKYQLYLKGKFNKNASRAKIYKLVISGNGCNNTAKNIKFLKV